MDEDASEQGEGRGEGGEVLGNGQMRAPALDPGPALPSRQVSPSEFPSNFPLRISPIFPRFFPRFSFLGNSCGLLLGTTPFILGFSTNGVPGRGCMSADEYSVVCPRTCMWKPRTHVFLVNFRLFRIFHFSTFQASDNLGKCRLSRNLRKHNHKPRENNSNIPTRPESGNQCEPVVRGRERASLIISHSPGIRRRSFPLIHDLLGPGISLGDPGRANCQTNQ